MKKLLTISVLGLVLGLTTVSHAQDKVNALGVQLPVVQRQIADQLQSDYSALHRDSISNVFGVHLPLRKVDRSKSDSSYDDYAFGDSVDQYIVVFGVKIPYRVS